jgi:hypothetical protein
MRISTFKLNELRRRVKHGALKPISEKLPSEKPFTEKSLSERPISEKPRSQKSSSIVDKRSDRQRSSGKYEPTN